jgi:hypothetical protein
MSETTWDGPVGEVPPAPLGKMTVAPEFIAGVAVWEGMD